MRKLISTLTSLVILGFVSSCDPTVDNPLMTGANLVKLTLDRIDKNAGMSYDLFSKMEKTIPYDSIAKIMKSSASKKIFIDKVMRASLAFYPSVVEANKNGLVLDYIPAPYEGEAEITLKAMISEDPSTDPVNAYRKMILEYLESTTDKDHKDWILIESFNDGEHNQPLPAESISLNFEKIKFMTTLTDIIMDLELSDEEVVETIDDVLNTKGIPPIAVGMLLPAIQKVREAAATTPEPFEESSMKWLDANAGQAINGGLNRDIIRRIQANIYLAGLHTVLLDDYPGTNQDMASLSILNARYRAALLMASAEMWQK